jgi:ASPIC and UnbV/FG-GAP-like repeat
LTYASWGLGVVTDFDNDGVADIVIAGKFYLQVLRGTSGGNFAYMDTAWGIRDTAAMSVDDGYAFGDIDRDGDLDLIGYRDTFPDRTLEVYRNDLAAKNWINVRPVGLAGNVGAGGAKIRIYAAGTQQLLWYEDTQNYDSQVAQSYYAYGETERHFGLGNRTNVDVEVTFYSTGRVTRVNNVTANQTLRVLESAGNVPQMAAATLANDGEVSPEALPEFSGRELQPMGQVATGGGTVTGMDRQQPAVVSFAPASFQAAKATEDDFRRDQDDAQLMKALTATADLDLYGRLVDELLASDVASCAALGV